MRDADSLLKDLALHAATLAANPLHQGARQAVWKDVGEWRAYEREKWQANSMSRLACAVEVAEAEAKAQPGHRADLEG